MSRTNNQIIRRHKNVGRAILGALSIFIVLSATGLVFPNAGTPDKTVVHFDIGTEIVDAHEARLAGIADRALDYPTMHLFVTGHTGSAGDKRANTTLSEQRAKVVRDRLVEHGISAERIHIRGAGGFVPVEPQENESPASVRARTKRVEIRFIENRALIAGGYP